MRFSSLCTLCVEQPAEIAPALRQALVAPALSVVDVVINRDLGFPSESQEAVQAPT